MVGFLAFFPPPQESLILHNFEVKNKPKFGFGFQCLSCIRQNANLGLIYTENSACHINTIMSLHVRVKSGLIFCSRFVLGMCPVLNISPLERFSWMAGELNKQHFADQ